MADNPVKDLAERLFAAIGAHDLKEIDEICADERLRTALHRFLRTFPDVEFRPAWVVAEGDMVAAWIDIEATHLGPFRGVAPTGKRVCSSAIYALKSEHDRFVDYWLGADGLALLEQIARVQIVSEDT